MVTDVADANRAFRGRSVISAEDFQKEDFLAVLDAARRFDPDGGSHKYEPLLQGRILATLFHEPSTQKGPSI